MTKTKAYIIGFSLIISLGFIALILVSFLPSPPKIPKEKSMAEILVPKRELTLEEKRQKYLRELVGELEERLQKSPDER